MGQVKHAVDFKQRLRTVIRAMFKGDDCGEKRCEQIVRIAYDALTRLVTPDKPMSEEEKISFAAEMFAEWSYAPHR